MIHHTLLTALLLFSSQCMAGSLETLDNKAHAIGGCASSLLIRNVASAVGVEHNDIAAVIGALAVEAVVQKYADHSPGAEDYRNAAIGAVVCVGVSEGAEQVGRSLKEEAPH